MNAETSVYARGCVYGIRTRCVYTPYRSRKRTYAAFYTHPGVRKRTHPRIRTHRRVFTHMIICGVGWVYAPTCLYAPDAAYSTPGFGPLVDAGTRRTSWFHTAGTSLHISGSYTTTMTTT